MALSPDTLRSASLSEIPTTSKPCSISKAAATELSTPPLMATTTRFLAFWGTADMTGHSGSPRRPRQADPPGQALSLLAGLPGMKAGVDLLEPGPVHLRVDLGCGDVGMPEHRLDAAQIGAPLQQVSCKGMTKLVRTD